MSTSDFTGPTLTTTPEIARIVRRAQYEALKAVQAALGELDHLTPPAEAIHLAALDLGVPWPDRDEAAS